VVGDRYGAEADALGGVEQRAHRRGAVGRVVRVHVQVHVDELFAAELLAQLRAPVRVVAARGNALVDLLELVGHARPVEVGARGGDRARVARHQLRVPEEALELRRERERVARLEQRPELAVAKQLLVLGQPRDHRHGPARHGAQHKLRRRPGPGRGRHRDRRAGEVLSLRAVSRAGQGHALAQAARQRGSRRGRRVAQPDRRPPVEVRRQAA
jgi:hypothetical protein